jgi:anaerobic magnesium-protoporphyrin IX monomethyl ester cyclase
MKILIINIALRPNSLRKFFPIGLGYIASAVQRAGFKFDLLDLDAHPKTKEETEKWLKDNKYDVVMMGCIVTGYKYVKWLVNTVKTAHPETTVIVGNTVASSIPDIILGKTLADIAVMGEGEITIVELLDKLRDKQDTAGVKGICYKSGGKVIRNPARPVIKDVNSIPFIDWDIFDVEVYIKSLSGNLNEPLPPLPKDQLRAMPLNTARGCPFNCTFCYHVFVGNGYRYRTPESVIAEMKLCNEKYGINYFTFNDELTFFSLKQMDAFAQKKIDSGLKIWFDSDCRSGMFEKEEDVAVAVKLKEAGCVALSYSLESANPDILKWMKKKVTPEAFSRQCKILKKSGLPILTSIVIGYPNETKDTIRQTIDVCIENGLYPSAGYLLPQPGTEMYEYAKQQGIIKDEEEYLLAIGDRQDLHVNLTKVSNEELQNTLKEELARCNKALGLGLQEAKLLKTGFYRSPKKKN